MHATNGRKNLGTPVKRKLPENRKSIEEGMTTDLPRDCGNILGSGFWRAPALALCSVHVRVVHQPEVGLK